jgi:hypothetical protein
MCISTESKCNCEDIFAHKLAHAMENFRGMEVELHAFLTSALFGADM